MSIPDGHCFPKESQEYDALKEFIRLKRANEGRYISREELGEQKAQILITAFQKYPRYAIHATMAKIIAENVEEQNGKI